MNIGDILGLLSGLFVVGFVIYCPIAFVLFVRKSEKEYKAQKAADLQWEKDELAKPRYVVKFIADGFVRSTGPLDPWQSNPGSDWNTKRTSKSLADSHMVASHERGYFRSDADMTYPSCNVVSAWIEELK